MGEACFSQKRGGKIMLSEKERERLFDDVGELYSNLIITKGLAFKQAKQVLRESVDCFVGHVSLD